MCKKIILIIGLFFTATVLNAQILVQKIPDENLCEIDLNFLQSGYKLAFAFTCLLIFFEPSTNFTKVVSIPFTSL